MTKVSFTQITELLNTSEITKNIKIPLKLLKWLKYTQNNIKYP